MQDEDVFRAGQRARLSGKDASAWPLFYGPEQVKIWGWGYADPNATI